MKGHCTIHNTSWREGDLITHCFYCADEEDMKRQVLEDIEEQMKPENLLERIQELEAKVKALEGISHDT